jgi:hypothetical protein
VPVIPAGANPNAATQVVGFAQIIIDHVQSTGSASQRGIYARARCANACGDGTCSAVESCTSCPADCGGCPATCP